MKIPQPQRLFSGMSPSYSLRHRSRLLDAARGLFRVNDGNGNNEKYEPIPCFALQAHHVQDNLIAASPHEFHTRLVQLIRGAQRRVSLASLYIGPAVAHANELELLQALEAVPSHVDVKIVMDSNRGLRKVPLGVGKNTTSAAEAVAKAIHLQDNHQLYLCQVLPNPLDQLLPNPLNEVAGVFHIKAYIIDDTLVLSGANLSEEYFTDRHDRYLQIQGSEVVDFYAQLIDILCHHASDPYPAGVTNKPIRPFWDHIHQLFSDYSPKSAQELLQDPQTVAVCVPTFHHPQITPPHDLLASDVDITLSLLKESAQENSSVQLASAYLNPSAPLLQALSRHPQVDFLTAGRLSHGFKPKPKAGNKGKAWIPTVFDHLQYQALLPNTRLWHWQREGWTFHAKGLWIREGEDLSAAVVGSSNFGRRSFERDMESNLVLVFPPESPLASQFSREWDLLLQSSQHVKDPKATLVDMAPPLPLHVRLCFPFIKSFF